MDAIEEYFQGEYIVEKNKIKEIDDLVIEVIKVLEKYDLEKGYPYVISKEPLDPKRNYSLSTNSMILFVYAKFLNSIDKESPILPGINWDFSKSLIKDLEKKLKIKSYNKKIEALVSTLKDKKQDDKIVYSGSFGDNDPFTLSWIFELININKVPFREVEKELVKFSLDRIKSTFKQPDNQILSFSKSNRVPSNHVFPLLRVIHLYKSCHKFNPILKDWKEIEKNVSIIVLNNLQNRINQQISHYTVQNSLFDTAELVMSLEGLLLLDDKRRIDENLVRKVFDILENNQKNNLNWRPLKPFVTSAQGDVLLPLSIEIANSLLRICKLLEKSKRYYFHEYADIFNTYTQWLLANVSQCKIGTETYKGWRSEHVQEPDVIHPWETAQVLTYLMTFKSMIQERIAHKSLKKSGLSCKLIQLEKKWNELWDTTDHFERVNCYEDIYKKFILPRKESTTVKPLFSMLVYGPPGTGKSSIAEELAANLEWRLITITPSDFISHGEADIESKAKSIFKTLDEQKGCVILFDEIDRLILDRDSSYYINQGDFYQFMTPSMLVKIKDLRTKEKCIFVIATNYAERIDSAIKRQGRIDEQYLVNALCLNERKSKISLFNNSLSNDKIDEIAKLTTLYTFTELKTLIKKNNFNNISKKEIKKKIEPPTVKLLNYQRRFQIEEDVNSKGEKVYKKSLIFPYKEFLALLYLKKECNEIFEEEEIKLIKDIVNLPGFKLENHFLIQTDIYKELKSLCDAYNEKKKDN